MNVKVEISAEYSPPHAVIYTNELTSEIQRAMDVLGKEDAPVTAQQGDRIMVLQADDIYMVRVEGGQTVLYGKKESYYYTKRLYEVADRLGNGFMQISKSTLVNLSFLSSVEAGFNGTLLLYLKNGLKDYVSRKYLPAFKQYLGIGGK